MNVLMMGCGAIGSFYAERLASAKVNVSVTARGEHLKALKQNGLTVVHDGEVRHHALPAYSHAELKEACKADDFDVIVIALKATQTQSALAELGSWFQAGSCPVLSVQNGVDNEPLLASYLGSERVWGGLSVRSGGEISQPGVATTTGIYKIILGPWPASDTLPAALTELAQHWLDQGVPLELSHDIRKELWRKLIVNCGVNPLSAAEQLKTYDLTHRPELAKQVYGAMQETARAASYDAVAITPDEVDEMFQLIKSFNSIKTSMLIDFEKGRELEIDAIMGSVIVRCRLLGKPAEITESLWQKLTPRPLPQSLTELFHY
ncbi:ketopantoate reductase family protein [Alteromonas lipolytica]|uniref:2-dehydropantoate 2-reductase n=1 Tax=Alteromonas lipolytica TaxID=1856405 RepID=A0A1E8FBI9_9ALTE|nr:2-dehydropantoate 2-reductase [Alteromonas lipolytica]OFI33292.1 hypothetical protein BFC17_03260 [Alteromonas lipolytica]GGF60938.1 2-dehydropantoate 2-reductase [Alteromonas lipolytica]